MDQAKDGPFGKEIEELETEFFDKGIDYSNAALYIPGMQVITSVMCISLLSIVVPWISPEDSVPPLRSVCCMVFTCVASTTYPLQIGTARGLSCIFSVLRPVPYFYVAMITSEQLLYYTIRAEDLLSQSGVPLPTPKSDGAHAYPQFPLALCCSCTRAYCSFQWRSVVPWRFTAAGGREMEATARFFV